MTYLNLLYFTSLINSFGYLLLCNKFSSNLVALNSKHLFAHVISVSQESGSVLAECFWLSVFHKVIAKMLVRARVIRRLDWG